MGNVLLQMIKIDSLEMFILWYTMNTTFSENHKKSAIIFYGFRHQYQTIYNYM